MIQASSQSLNLKKDYYVVDRREIYVIIDNVPQLSEVNYFEGKIMVSQNDNRIKCLSLKTNKEYFKIENLKNGKYQISENNSNPCSGIIDTSSFGKENFTINLKNKNFILKYYLIRLTTDDEIYTNISSGSGIIINSNTVLTNYHVVKATQKIVVEFQNKKITCSLIKFNENLDIALLKVNEDTFSNKELLSFANYDIKIGEQVFASGFPLVSTMGKELKITSGIISSLKGFNDDDKYFQTSAPIDPGNSGGLLIDKFGNIIGLITAKHSLGTNVGYSVKIKFLINENFVEKAASNRIVMSTQDIYNKAKKTVCIIKSFAL